MLALGWAKDGDIYLSTHKEGFNPISNVRLRSYIGGGCFPDLQYHLLQALKENFNEPYQVNSCQGELGLEDSRKKPEKLDIIRILDDDMMIEGEKHSFGNINILLPEESKDVLFGVQTFNDIRSAYGKNITEKNVGPVVWISKVNVAQDVIPDLLNEFSILLSPQNLLANKSKNQRMFLNDDLTKNIVQMKVGI